MQLKICLGATQQKVKWRPEYSAFPALKSLVSEQLGVDEEMVLYYLDEEAARCVLDDNTIGRFVERSQGCKFRCVYVDLPNSPVVTDRSFASLDELADSTSSSHNINWKGRDGRSAGIKSVLKRGEGMQEDNNQVIRILESLMEKIEVLKRSMETRIDSICCTQQRILQEVNSLKAEGKQIEDKVDRLVKQTSEDIAELKTHFKNKNQSLVELMAKDIVEMSIPLTRVISERCQDPKPPMEIPKTESNNVFNLGGTGCEPETFKDCCFSDYAACNKCNTCPIEGDRYQCDTCTSFILCSRCNASNPHKHVLRFISRPDDVSIFQTQIEMSISSLLSSQREVIDPRCSQQLRPEPNIPNWEAKKDLEARYQALNNRKTESFPELNINDRVEESTEADPFKINQA